MGATYLLNRHRMVLHRNDGSQHSDNIALIKGATVYEGEEARSLALRVVELHGARLCRRCFRDGRLT